MIKIGDKIVHTHLYKRYCNKLSLGRNVSFYNKEVPEGKRPFKNAEEFHPYDQIRSLNCFQPFSDSLLLSIKTNSLNIAQGFPDYDTLDILKTNMNNVLENKF